MTECGIQGELGYRYGILKKTDCSAECTAGAV